MEELDAPIAGVGPEQARLDGVRQGQADERAEQRAEDTRRRRMTQLPFERHHEPGKNEREDDVDGDAPRQRLQHRGRVPHCGNDNDTPEREPRHLGPPVDMPRPPRRACG